MDYNGDGVPDLITANWDNQPACSVLLGRGDGTFQLQRSLFIGSRPTAVVVVDLNGDGLPDLITANSTEYISVWLGGSSSRQRVTVREVPRALAVADVDGDGIPDLVTANADSDSVSVLLGQGDGTFQPEQRFAVGRDPWAVVVADLNGDGVPDLVTANLGSASVSVLLHR